MERSVNYTGANGISNHAFVVRKLFYGPKGTPLVLKGEEEIVRGEASIAAIEADMKTLQNDPQHQTSWPKHLRNFAGWRPHPEYLNHANLGVVAWVQDMKSMNVLQASYVELPPGPDRKSNSLSSGGTD